MRILSSLVLVTLLFALLSDWSSAKNPRPWSCYTLPLMQYHSFFKNLSSLSKITRATSLKIGASYAKNWAGDLLVRIYPQLRINKSDIPNTVSYYYKKLLNIDNSKCIIRHYTKKKRSQLHNLTQFETSKNLIT